MGRRAVDHLRQALGEGGKEVEIRRALRDGTAIRN